MLQVRSLYPAVCMLLGLRVLLRGELGEMVGVRVRSPVSLTLVQPQLGAVDDEVLGPVLSFRQGQGANLRHLGVDPTNKYIRA